MSRSLLAVTLALTACAESSLNLRVAPPSKASPSPLAEDPLDETTDPLDDGEPSDDNEDQDVEEDSEEDSEDPSSDCPEGVICVDALPYVHDGSTSGGESDFDSYACASSTDESGPEQRYRVTLAEDGLIVASLDGLPEGVDVDVHILEESDPERCIDRGHWDAAALLPAGTYWVVVDSWVDDDGIAHDGNYTLTLSQTTSSSFSSDGLDTDALDAALYAFDRAWQLGETDRLQYAVLDFATESIEPRLFVFDLRTSELLFSELATHGIGSQDPSDLTMADWFSDTPGSNASSLGLIRAAETYYGDHGYSMRLDGLEDGFNGNVRDRAIVVHSADYATQDFVDDYGYLGRSQGCPAVDPLVSDAIIDTMTDGALLFAYYPDPVWIGGSEYLAGY